MSKSSETTSTLDLVANLALTAGSLLAQKYGGNVAEAAASFLLGEAAFTASAVDLATKIKSGEATGEDVADMLSTAASTLAGFGVLAGLANPVSLSVAGVAGAALTIYETWISADAKEKFWDGFFKGLLDPSLGFSGNEIFPLLITTITYADGSYKVTLHDDLGQSTTSEYTTDGRLTHKSWQNADGSRGDTQYRADGSSSGIVVRADGSYQRFADDGKGTSVLIQYDANGNQTRQQWHNADGSYGAEYTDPNGQRHGTAYAPNGSYRNYTLDPDGRQKSNTFDSDGRFISSGGGRAQKRSALRRMPPMDNAALNRPALSQTSKRPTFQPCW